VIVHCNGHALSANECSSEQWEDFAPVPGLPFLTMYHYYVVLPVIACPQRLKRSGKN